MVEKFQKSNKEVEISPFYEAEPKLSISNLPYAPDFIYSPIKNC